MWEWRDCHCFGTVPPKPWLTPTQQTSASWAISIAWLNRRQLRSQANESHEIFGLQLLFSRKNLKEDIALLSLVEQIVLQCYGCITLSIKAFFLLITVHNTVSHRIASAKSGKTREYYIAAVELDWDYAPSGMNNAKGLKLQDDR